MSGMDSESTVVAEETPEAIVEKTGNDSTEQEVTPDDSEDQPSKTQAPETEPTEIQPPETQPPETQPPETQPPETQQPETQPPETQQPETQPPETQQPETQPTETQPTETQLETQDADQNQNNAVGEEQAAAEGEGGTTGDEQPEVQEDQPAPGSADGEGKRVEGQPAPGSADGEGKTEEGQPDEGSVEDTPKPTTDGGDQSEVAGESGEQGEAEVEAGGDQEKGETEEGKSPEQNQGDEETQGQPESPEETGEEPTPDSAGGEVSVAEGELAPVTPGDEEQEPQLQSERFSEGERPESPLAVGEKLSREGSPTQDHDHLHPEALEPATPDRVSEAGEETPQELLDIEEDEAQPEIDRAQLIERYHAAISERDQLQQQNYQLQHKTAEYFRKKKSDESRQDFDKNVSDQEQRYIKYMANLEELRKQEGQETEHYHIQIEELKERCQEKQERVEAERVRFADFKKQVALNSINSRSGKTIPPKDIEQYLSTENRKDKDVVNVRLENIKLKNKLKKKEQQLKSKEELAEGLHLIDFEQLKIENQTYNEKIEERNEELLKLRKKITSTVQVLTHLKEKLQFVQAENHVQNRRLRDVESVAAQKRDILSRTKQARDALRIDNQKLRQNCGLLGNEPLLRNFEEQRDESDGLKMKLEKLRMQHAELTLNCNQVRRKIEQARMNQI